MSAPAAASRTVHDSDHSARKQMTLPPFTGDAAANNTAKWGRWTDALDAVLITLVVILTVALHLRFVTHVGGLWRDETNSVDLATLPTVGEVWRFLDYDSFPILFFAVLRVWLGVFGPANDAALRVLGCLIGLGLLGALWFNARAFGVRWPVLSLALVGLNPMIIRYGDSTRAYGLGMILIVLTFRSFWRLVNTPAPPSPRRVLMAAVFALLSVQCLYYNSVLLFAIAAGAIAVALRKRAWRTAGIILAIGVLSAASLLPYVPIIRRMQEWTFLVGFPADLPWLWKRSCEVFGSPDPLGIWLWAGLFLTGIGGFFGLAVWRRGRVFLRLPIHPFEAERSSDFAQRSPNDAVLFAMVAVVVGVVSYAAFLRALHYYTQPWYYITLACFAACALEIVFGAWPIAEKVRASFLPRGIRLVVAFILFCLAGLPAWEEMTVRHTNLDLVAGRLRSLATKGDLILVPRWECAIPLSRYYTGPARIVTLPPIADHRFHRYDLILQQMTGADPIPSVLAQLEDVLRSGHRVFLAGELPFPKVTPVLPPWPPIYRDSTGAWHGNADTPGLRLQAGQFLRAHATGVGQIEVPVPDKARVQDYEDLGVTMVEGWRQTP